MRLVQESNRAYLQSDGTLVARLSPGELLLLADPFVPSDEMMVFSLEDDYQCYSVRRQDSHYWFSLAGALCSDMFAKLCGVDLSGANFPNHSIAQTSVARTSAIIVRHDSGYTPCYHLLGESSTSRYMWSCLVDALNEYVVPCCRNARHQSALQTVTFCATPYSGPRSNRLKLQK